MLSNWKRLRLQELSDIKIDVFTSKSRVINSEDIIVIKYEGFYRFGSFGDDDGKYMNAMTRASLAAWEPSAVILDWTDLKYEWGELLKLVLDFVGEQNFKKQMPLAVVVGPDCEEAVRLLLLGIHSKGRIGSIPWIFGDMNKAYDYIEGQLAKACRYAAFR